jgi:carboxyl-terminal processing protease
MVWKDTCFPFENGNETAYNEDLMHALDPVGANLTAPADFSNRSWTAAFLALDNLFRERYAFTDWRAIDWDARSAEYAPRIAAAEKAGDRAAFYRALREYIFSVPDGHVQIAAPDDFGTKHADVGGGFGFAVSRLDSGKVIVSYVANGSAAEKAGIAYGDEVTGWNGKPVQDAINVTSILWTARKPSTTEGILLQQQRFLTRAPVGTTTTVTLANGTAAGSRTISLAAYDDQYDTMIKTTTFLQKRVDDTGITTASRGILPQISDNAVTSRVLPGGYTYIAVYQEDYATYQPFKAAMQQAIANNSPGIVLDFRFNNGGDDNLASCFAGWFVDKPVFYEYGTKYDPGTGKFTRVWEAWTAPRPTGYSGPVAVLVSPYAVSSGEGLPMVFAHTGRGAIISFYGTNGAFGMEGVQAYMPLNLTILFPDGASLDQAGKIQVDSDLSLRGGIAPTIRVPLNEDTVARSMTGEDLQMTYALRWLDGRQIPQTPAAAGPTPVTTAKTPLPVVLPVLAVGFILALLAERKRG